MLRAKVRNFPQFMNSGGETRSWHYCVASWLWFLHVGWVMGEGKLLKIEPHWIHWPPVTGDVSEVRIGLSRPMFRFTNINNRHSQFILQTTPKHVLWCIAFQKLKLYWIQMRKSWQVEFENISRKKRRKKYRTNPTSISGSCLSNLRNQPMSNTKTKSPNSSEEIKIHWCDFIILLKIALLITVRMSLINSHWPNIILITIMYNAEAQQVHTIKFTRIVWCRSVLLSTPKN